MRWKHMLPLFASLTFVAPALASMGGGGGAPKEPETPSSTSETQSESQATARQQAERYYGDAYDEIAKAKKDLGDSKDKNAEKHFRKALDRARNAVELDSTYHEAWNLVGYASRKLKNYDQAIAAYLKCLGIKFDYAPAREYLGEAYIETGKVAQAREQLAVLERLKASDSVTELKASIDAYVAAHPEAAAPADSAAAAGGEKAAPADSTATKP